MSSFCARDRVTWSILAPTWNPALNGGKMSHECFIKSLQASDSTLWSLHLSLVCTILGISPPPSFSFSLSSSLLSPPPSLFSLPSPSLIYLSYPASENEWRYFTLCLPLSFFPLEFWVIIRFSNLCHRGAWTEKEMKVQICLQLFWTQLSSLSFSIYFFLSAKETNMNENLKE